jgi:hypothetical protein
VRARNVVTVSTCQLQDTARMSGLPSSPVLIERTQM